MKDLTPVAIAAHQAADREFKNRERCGNQVVYLDTFYVRAFLAGARWQQQQVMDERYGETEESLCALAADKDTSPATGSTASPDTGEREHRGKP